MQKLHRVGRNRDSTLRRCTQYLTCIRIQHKARPPQERGLDLTRGLGGSPGVVGVGCSSLWGQGHCWWTQQRILISVSSPRGLYFGTKTWPHPTAYRLQRWIASGQTTNNRGTQPHASADKLPKVVLSSQLPQNIPLDMALPIRGKRPSFTNQRTGTSPTHQEAYTSP